MKKTLLTLGMVLGVSAMAFGQGSIYVQGAALAGFNTVSSNPNDSGAGGTYSDFISGTVSLQLFSQTTAADASLLSQATAINTDAAAGNESGAAALLAADFTQQNWGLTQAAESSTYSLAVTGGTINPSQEADYAVGTASTLTSGAVGLYALEATWSNAGTTYTGVIVLNGAGAQGLGGGSNPAFSMNINWPNQNILLTPVPEPTTLALAGLGGLSMLFLRRRKV